MIRLRNLACAYLQIENKYLMMKRAPTMKLYPNFWSPVGGHLEQTELNDPISACKREIYEESGLTENDLSNLNLKYMTVRRKEDEIRIQYIYFGRALKEETTQCSEGEFHWISQEDILKLEMSYVNTSILSHYFKVGQYSSEVYVAVASGDNKNPKIVWATLENLDTLL